MYAVMLIKTMTMHRNFLVWDVVRASKTKQSNKLDDASDFLVRGSDRCLLASRQKMSFERIKQNEHAHSIQFSQTRFLNLEKLGDVNNTLHE